MTRSQDDSTSTAPVAGWLSRSAASAVVFLVCLAVGSSLSAVFWDVRSQPSTVAPLQIAPADLDLGTVWQQSDLDFVIPIRNVSAHDVTVNHLAASCNCTELTPTSFVVRAGQTCEISGTLDLLHAIPNEQDAEAPFFVGLRAQTTSDPAQTWDWPLQGTVRRAVKLSPAVIQLKGVREVVEGVAPPIVEVEVIPLARVTALRADCGADGGEASLEGPDEQGHFRLKYSPPNGLPRGEIDHQITLQIDLAESDEIPVMALPVKGSVVGPVRISPPQVTLAGKAVHDEGQEVDIHVLSRDGRTWTVTEMDAIPPWLTATVSHARDSIRFELEFEPDDVTSALVPLTLTSSSDPPKHEHMSVRVNYNPVTHTEMSFSGKGTSTNNGEL